MENEIARMNLIFKSFISLIKPFKGDFKETYFNIRHENGEMIAYMTVDYPGGETVTFEKVIEDEGSDSN